jgi:DNA-binding XRE family transcriptional regulator/quercetin dioxygenase-like cupin family protein
VDRPSVARVGERIRMERQRQGVSLRSLARTVGVSASFVSQIETGKCQPSVNTLYAITTALGISVEEVFEQPAAAADGLPGALPGALPGSAVPGSAVPGSAVPGSPVPGGQAMPRGEASPGEAAPGEAAAGLALVAGGAAAAADTEMPAGGRRVGPLVRPAHREILELDSGVTWERLGHVPGIEVDFLLVTYPPGSSSSSTGQLMRHAGTEYGYLIQGELIMTLGFDDYLVSPGDAISFRSATPHRYRNDGDVPAVGVWYVTDAG